MPSVVHVVTTGNFAGVERYVCNTANELAGRDWQVSIVGGDASAMSSALEGRVRWLPGATAAEALGSLAKLGKQEVCHVHMTIAEAVGVAASPLHRAPIVSTRHFAARRGSTPLARALAPLISAGISREIAVSEFVARSIERRPDAVLLNSVPPSPCLWQPSSRVVLVLGRLEVEKDTLTALRAWQLAQLWRDGWSLRIVGDGSERPMLERWASSNDLQNVAFAGWTHDVPSELEQAGVLLAPAPSEPCGLGVLEAMAAGVPAVACSGGGHLETIGLVSGAPLFPAGDYKAAAGALRMVLADEVSCAVSTFGRRLVANDFSPARHVERLLEEYQAVRAPQRGARTALRDLTQGRSRPASARTPPMGSLEELVVCSLEAWDEVWRRNQFFTKILLLRNPGLRVLFIEPAADPVFDLANRRRPSMPRFRRIPGEGRLHAFRPIKVLPRRAGPLADAFIHRQVLLVARLLGYSRPTLWVNDVTYAPLIGATGWPSLYDVTDDWLAGELAPRQRERLEGLEEIALNDAQAVVVCSPGLKASRGRARPVIVVPNAVDAAHFERARRRPVDLPASPVAVYVGSLHESRLDVELVIELARSTPSLRVALVGPDSLERLTRRRLVAEPNILLLGARPYDDVPAYLQHADVIIVPHLVNEFTESLDPIKAYECLASPSPTVATPVAGFRGREPAITLAPRETFVQAFESILAGKRQPRGTTGTLPTWEDRAEEFEEVLLQARSVR